MQVFKGIKNGVQDVAVKVLINSDEIQVQMFQEVRLKAGRDCNGWSTLFITLHDCMLCFCMRFQSLAVAAAKPLHHALCCGRVDYKGCTAGGRF